MSVEFLVLMVSWGFVALMALLIFAVWPDVLPQTWGWLALTVVLAMFNTTRVVLGF